MLDNPRDEANIAAVREKVNALTARFPVYRYSQVPSDHEMPFCSHLETKSLKHGCLKTVISSGAAASAAPRQAFHDLRAAGSELPAIVKKTVAASSTNAASCSPLSTWRCASAR